MKKAIVTRADENVQDWVNLTHPAMKQYSKFCGADFIVLSDPPPFLTNSGHPAYSILEVEKVLNDYDRVVHLDTDMIINKGAPNIFDIVPHDHIGIVAEDVGTRKQDRMLEAMKIQHEFGDIGWRENYYNVATMVLSKPHIEIFQPHNGKYWTGWAGEQTHISFNIIKTRAQVLELGYKWNHMTMFSEAWNGSPSRFDSHIIHYAGRGIFEKDKIASRIEQARYDYGKIYGNKQK